MLKFGAAGQYTSVVRSPIGPPVGFRLTLDTHRTDKTVFTNKDGSLNSYALACGYIDTVITRELDNDATAYVKLSHNGATYDVHITRSDEYMEMIELNDGRRILAGWAQFDSLAEARKFIRKLSQGRGFTEWLAACIAVMA